jgi:hypothetical protein
MIVVNNEDVVIGYGESIEIVDAQGEENLIKVTINGGFYYIGTDDREFYQIIDIDTPDNTKTWKYIDGQFEEIIFEDLEDIE